MSRIGMGVVPPDDFDDDDSDDSGDEGGGFRIGAEPVAAPPKSNKLSDNFIPAKQFDGPKEGMSFKRGPLGLGYYKATAQPSKPIFGKNAAKPEAKAPMAAPKAAANFAVPPGLQKRPPTVLKRADTPAMPNFNGTSVAGAQKANDLRAMLEHKQKTETPGFQSVPKDEEEEPQPSKKSGWGKMFKGKAKQAGPSSVIASATPHADDDISSQIAQIHVAHGDIPPPARPKPAPVPAPSPVAAPKPAPLAVPAKPAAPAHGVATEPRGFAKSNDLRLNETVKEVEADTGLSLPSTVHDMDTIQFKPVTRSGTTLYTSAHGPMLPSGGFVRGELGPGGMAADAAQMGSIMTALNLLKSIKASGHLKSITRVVKVNVAFCCNSEPKEDKDVRNMLQELCDSMSLILRKALGGDDTEPPVVSVTGVAFLPQGWLIQADIVCECA